MTALKRVRFLLALTLCGGVLCAVEPRIGSGDLNGARFRIDSPDKRNGGLVMDCHGYAVAQYGKPKETFLTGRSIGGFTTMALIEEHPNDYDAALPLCGALAPATWCKLRATFDGRVLFDNRNTICTSFPDSNTVNEGVERCAADPRAAECRKTFYVLTGRLTCPMLPVHTTCDPLTPAWITGMYGMLAHDVGNADLFVRQCVKHDGRRQILPAEIGKALQQLKPSKDGGERPRSGRQQHS